MGFSRPAVPGKENQQKRGRRRKQLEDEQEGAWGLESKAEEHEVVHQRHLCRADIGTRGKAALLKGRRADVALEEGELNPWSLLLLSFGFVPIIEGHTNPGEVWSDSPSHWWCYVE